MPGPFADDEPVATLVERPRCALRIVVARATGPASRRSRRRALRACRFRCRPRASLGRRRAGSSRTPRRSPCPEDAHADTVAKFGPRGPKLIAIWPAPTLRDAHRDQERRDAVGAARREGGDVVEERVHAAEPGGQDDAGLLRLLTLEAVRQAGHVHRLAGRDEPELDVAVRAPEVLAGPARARRRSRGPRPAICDDRRDGSKASIRRTPDRPATRPRHDFSTPVPSAVMRPRPVTTTRGASGLGPRRPRPAVEVIAPASRSGPWPRDRRHRAVRGRSARSRRRGRRTRSA